MKIKNLAYIAPISILILGGGALGFLEIHKKAVIPNQSRQYQQAAPHSKLSVSIPKSVILILLAVGVVGVLSVSRKKNSKGNPAQQKKLQTASDDRDKAFIKLNKEYLNLQYKITQHRFSGESPPDGLIEAIYNIERKVRLISRALE
jgi:F0F1-type ATP synthase assembly protein I